MSPKLCDFGSARFLPQGQDFVQVQHCETTYQVAPPEVLRDFRYYMSCDAWSLGIVLQCMQLCEDTPWPCPPLGEGEERLASAARVAEEHADGVAFQDLDEEGAALQGRSARFSSFVLLVSSRQRFQLFLYGYSRSSEATDTLPPAECF